MMDEDDLQRRELARLLSTATDEERREVIRKAMNALDGHESSVKSEKFSPMIQNSISNAQSMPLVESMSSSRLRPMSARRRPSVTNLLDAIPEVMKTDRTSGGKEEEIMLPYDDIAEVVCSSFDARYQPKSIFKSLPGHTGVGVSSPGGGSMLGLPHQYPGHHPSLSRGNSNLNLGRPLPPRPRGLWMSTGMMPQFIVVTFYEKWLIKKIELQTIGIHQVSVHVNFSASSAFSPAKLLEMRKIGDEFSVEVINKSASSNNLGGSLSGTISPPPGGSEFEVGVNGIGVTIIIQKGDVFCGISHAKIIVAQHT